MTSQPSAGQFRLEEGAQVPGLPYRLVHKLGQGAYGQVWKAINPETHEVYALKFCWDAEALETLRNEARHLVRIKESADKLDGFVKLRELYYNASPLPFVAYEYVEGENLAEVLDKRFAKGGEFSPFEAAEIVLELATIVARIHTLKPDPIVHRDLKPANIMVVHAGLPWKFKIADFGVGVMAVTSSRAQQLPLSDIGRRMGPAGTPVYWSIEQSEFGHDPHPSDDVHALGVMWYELLKGRINGEKASPVIWTNGSPYPPSHDPGFDWDDLHVELMSFGLSDPQTELLESCLKTHKFRPQNAQVLAEKIGEVYPPLQMDAAEICRLKLSGGSISPYLRSIAESRFETWTAAANDGIAEACWLTGLLWDSAPKERRLYRAPGGRPITQPQFDTINWPLTRAMPMHSMIWVLLALIGTTKKHFIG